MTRALSAELGGKYERLLGLLGELRSPLVAYSGGVDSTFLLAAAVAACGAARVRAAVADGPSQPRAELEEARRLAAGMGVELEVVAAGEMDCAEYRANGPGRCYYCKSALFGRLKAVAQARGCDAVLTGTNADDEDDYRPGRRAEREYAVRTPLLEVGLGKEEIRALSRWLGLATAEQPARPCLASRLAYGVEVTRERLGQVERAEGFLRGLGLVQLRVRHHGQLARIEVPADQIASLAVPGRREEIASFLKGLGFTWVTLDLQGFRSGSQNEGLAEKGV